MNEVVNFATVGRVFLPVVLLLLGIFPGRAQSFLNGDMEGFITGTSVIPPFWQNVPYTDPLCNAVADYAATPDLTDVNGPAYDNGIMGNPYSGQTFVSGLWFSTHHEGLMQTVQGFTVGCTYTIGLHQTVVKQINADALDTSGSWSVYADNTLIGTTVPTVSNEPAISLNKPWERRELTFMPTATSHTIKFLPADDDADQVTDGLRMGIDSVYIQLGAGSTTGLFLGNDTALCVGANLLLSTGIPSAEHRWQDGSTGSSFEVNGPGTYWVTVTIPCGVIRDTIVVTEVDPLPLGLGPDLVLCEGQTAVLDAAWPGASHLWQDGSTADTLVVDSSGTCWVAVDLDGCSRRDTVEVLVEPCGVVLILPNVFTPNGDGSNARFTPIERTGIRSLSTTIYNRWGNALFTTTHPDINWSGRSNSGEEAPDGTYYWVVEFTDVEGVSRSLSGVVTLLR